MKTYGPHLLGDLEGTVPRLATDGEFVYRFLNELVKVTKMNAIGSPHLDLYTGEHRAWAGFSGTIHIQTSHITMHIFELGYTFLDIFSCKPFDVEFTKKYIEKTLAPEQATWALLYRGANFPAHHIDPAQAAVNVEVL